MTQESHHGVFTERLCSVLHAKSLQLCLTLCNPMDCSPPGSSVHGHLQARTLEWVAVSSSRGSPRPREQNHGPWQAASSSLMPPGKPYVVWKSSSCSIRSGMDLDSTPLGEISQTGKDKDLLSHLYMEYEKKSHKPKKVTHRKRDKTCDYQGQSVGSGAIERTKSAAGEVVGEVGTFN